MDLTKILFVLASCACFKNIICYYPPADRISTYRYMDRYRDHLADVGIRCPGYICHYSGLEPLEKEEMLFYNNKIRDEFARKYGISNYYLLEWDETYLTMHSQVKAASCLPDTENFVIYDYDSVKNWSELLEDPTKKPQGIEVIVGSRTISINDHHNLTEKDVKRSAPSYYSLLFNSEEDLFRRHTTTVMGCGYMLRNTGQHIIDHIVCSYGMVFLEVEHRDITRHSTFCQNCKTAIVQNSSTLDNTLNCDETFTHLCRSGREKTEIKKNVVICGNPKPTPLCWKTILLLIVVVLLLLFVMAFCILLSAITNNVGNVLDLSPRQYSVKV